MKNDKFLELIHKELDGFIEPSEQQKLDSHLAENKEAGQVRRELSQVSAFLRNAGSLEPPTYLKKRILNSLPSERYPEFSVAGILRAKLSTIIKPGLKFAYVFAAGVVACLVLLSIFERVPNPDDSGLTGTVLQDISRYNLKSADRIVLAENQVSGVLETQLGPDKVSVVVGLKAASEMNIELQYDTAALQIRSLDNSAGTLTSVASGEGLIKMRGSQVAGHIVFGRESESSSPVTVRISVGPEVIERSLATIIPR